MFITEKRLWLTADRTQVVPDGDERARYLLVGEGGTVTDAMIADYDLTPPEAPKGDAADEDGTPATAPATKPPQGAVAAKVVTPPKKGAH